MELPDKGAPLVVGELDDGVGTIGALLDGERMTGRLVGIGTTVGKLEGERLHDVGVSIREHPLASLDQAWELIEVKLVEIDGTESITVHHSKVAAAR